VKHVLSPKEVAEIAGVSESSLKRWADSGRLKVARTAGGHRRIHVQEVIRFLRDSNLPVLRPDLLGVPELAKQNSLPEGLDELTDLFFEMLQEGRGAEVRAIVVDRYISGHSVAAICDGPLAGAIRRIGDLWRHESQGIAIEHRATDACIQTLSFIRTLLAPPPTPGGPEQDPRPVAIGGAPSQDPTIMTSLMIACVLCEAGYRDINLGADTPIDSLIGAVESSKPRLVWLTCSHEAGIPAQGQFGRLADVATTHGGVLVVGGRALVNQVQPSPGRIEVCQSLGELAGFARGLIQQAG